MDGSVCDVGSWDGFGRWLNSLKSQFAQPKVTI